jgi:putative DNA primase/helicase
VTRYNDQGAEKSSGPEVDTSDAKNSGSHKSGSRRRAPVLFDKEGLKALKASEEVLKLGPLRYGSDSQFWAYSGGVWSPGEDVVHGRIVRTLGDRYRPAHNNAIRDVTRALVDRIDCSPVPRFINFTNGLLDWRAPGGPQLVAHSPDVPTTVQLTIPWDPKAECADFRAFLDDVIPADDLMRVWEVIGYMLLSGNPLHRAFLLAGGGRNGKGAFMRTLLSLMNPDNVSNVPLHDLSASRFATAQLFGKLANVCGDIDATYLENTGRLKEITGEDQVQAEHKFGQPFRFTAWCSMLFSANEIPGSADSSKGWVDRWEVIPFPKYVGNRVDKTLEPRMQTQASLQGIAAAAVSALRVLMDREAFRTTETAQAAKVEFQRKSNPLYTWIDERMTVTGEDGDFVKGQVLFEDFKVWADMVGMRDTGRTKFYARLKQLGDLGVTPVKRNGTDGYKGIKLGVIA